MAIAEKNYADTSTAANAGYDANETVFWGAGSLATLQASIQDLYELINSLNERVEALENP